MNLIAKPSKDNIKTYVPVGLSLVSLSFLELNKYYKKKKCKGNRKTRKAFRI